MVSPVAFHLLTVALLLAQLSVATSTSQLTCCIRHTFSPHTAFKRSDPYVSILLLVPYSPAYRMAKPRATVSAMYPTHSPPSCPCRFPGAEPPSYLDATLPGDRGFDPLVRLIEAVLLMTAQPV